MNYLLIDESDPTDCFECEGEVLKTFFTSTKIFDRKPSLELIRKNNCIESKLITNPNKFFNIVQFSAHGSYTAKTKSSLDYSAILKRRGNKEVEIFRPDSIVRTGLKANIFLSTNCQTFNPLFIDILRNYQGINNYIAPVNSPYIGDTLIFSMMFYNVLLRKLSSSAKILDHQIIGAFKQANSAYMKYNMEDQFRLFNCKTGKIIK